MILESVLLLGSLSFLAYKSAMWVQPLSGFEQTPHTQKIDPQTRILQYYRQYPERYIRISKETWQYEGFTRTALHSFTLRNSATVPYQEIEIRFAYESSDGKTLYTHVFKIPGTLAALGSRKLDNIKVKDVPAAAINVVLTVTGAKP